MTPLTFERLASLTGAEPIHAPHDPSPGWRGECPVCGSRRYLWLDPYADETAVVRCVSGVCEPAAILAAFGLGLADVEPCPIPEIGPAFVVSHSLDLSPEPLLLNRFARLAIDRAGLANLPDPEPLIADTIDRRSVALLAGYHGTGKSFVSLDWSACVATGVPWQGRDVEPGHVLYIVGEGAFGIDARLRAWESHRDVSIPADRFVVIPRGVQVADDAERRDFLAFVEDAGPFDLIAFDTLARCAVGLDENSARDVGLFVDGLGEISRAADATVVVVHHTGKDRSTVRGSSALESGMDTVYVTEEGGGPGFVNLTRTKRKDGRTFDDHRLRLEEVGDSVILRALDDTETPEQPELLSRAFGIVRASFGDRIATRSELVRVLVDNGMSRPSAYRKVSDLDAMGVLVYASTDADRTPRFRLALSAAKTAGLPLDPIGVVTLAPSLHDA
jgi:hypothetical protein